MRDLTRLLRPKSIAVMGGGDWCRQVVRQSLAMGFAGDIFRVHPVPDPVEGIAAVPSLDDLPYPPDAVFLGVNRHTTVDAVARLARMDAGGAVCFASGFSEAKAEDSQAVALQEALIEAAGDMPILGPNCYGFVNAVDGALLWPDQHGCAQVDRGVAILAQSSNIAINLTMQQRALPISYVITCGNMAQSKQADIAMSLLDDPRVTAIGLHIEGFGDPAAWHALSCKAHARGVPIVALKVGRSQQAQHATVSHTGSIAGSDAGASALLRYLGIPRVYDLQVLLETLMLLHCNGPLESAALSSISCSGGEACLAADLADSHAVVFPPLDSAQEAALATALGPMVALSNPLDYHTYVWGCADKMAAAWLPMAAPHIGLTLIILDYPHTDPSAWESATQAAIMVKQTSARPVAVVATLPELLPRDVADRLLAAGVTPLRGLNDALAAAAAAAQITGPAAVPPLLPNPNDNAHLLPEHEAKALLGQFGLKIPKGTVTALAGLEDAAKQLAPPYVLKSQGLAHKSEGGAVRLNLSHSQLVDVAKTMPGEIFLLEEMAQGCVVELLVGVVCDPAHGMVLTLAAGGVLTELWQDGVSLIMPVSAHDLETALTQLRIAPLLDGYRGAPAANIDAIVQAVLAVQDCIRAHLHQVHELEINPLICTKDGAIAADALITLSPKPPIGETPK
ncbi:MAG: acetate--CoA ligase family protein [Roseobacter sp.]